MEYPDDMSESDSASTAVDLEALRALQADASDLERIEELLRGCADRRVANVSIGDQEPI
jgi:hypothetical protein